MIYDNKQKSNTYEAKKYAKKDFAQTRCPKCGAVGRFNLHGEYMRHVIYYDEEQKITTQYMMIKRVKCKSCKTTHGVLPIDVIAYKLLSLYVVMAILLGVHEEKKPVLSIAAEIEISYQFIYECLKTYKQQEKRVKQYLRQMWPRETPTEVTPGQVLKQIPKPYTEFQSNYIRENKRPWYMSKFADGIKGPAIGKLG